MDQLPAYDDDHIELVDEFLAGLSKSASQPEWVDF
jgi:hypothetical protein